MAKSSDINDIGILRGDEDLGDVLRVFESDARPGLTGVERFVHSVAVGNVAANAGFTGADVKDVGIGRRYRDGADRHDPGLVSERQPGSSRVCSLPDAAGHRAEIVRIWIAGYASDRERAATAKRSDLAPLHGLQGIFVQRLRMERRQDDNGCHDCQASRCKSRQPPYTNVLRITHESSPENEDGVGDGSTERSVKSTQQESNQANTFRKSRTRRQPAHQHALYHQMKHRYSATTDSVLSRVGRSSE